MEVPTYVALSRLAAQERAVEATATNLANASTPGFKAERTLFADWLSQQRQAAVPPGGRAVAYVQDRATYREQRQGTVMHTGNPLDVAISGDGFFTVQTLNGPRLTRAGRFSPGSDGTLQDSDGHALLDRNGRPLQIAQSDTQIHIAADGTVSSENGLIGRIGVVSPSDPYRLKAEGAHLFRSDSDTTPVAQPRLVQGGLEESNVEPVLEMTRMTKALREFQFVAQFVQAETDRQQSAIEKIAQPHGS